MNIETEKKFLVKDKKQAFKGILDYVKIKQGYLDTVDPTVRIRVINNRKTFLTIKKEFKENTRFEFEYEIPYKDGIKLYRICPFKLEKTRHLKRENGLLWEIDEYKNSDLVIAEIETKKKRIKLPSWVGEEIKYSNYDLARKKKYRR